VTALYEVIPVGVESDVEVREPEPLRYQQPGLAARVASDELLTVQVRYKDPEGDHSQQLALPVVDSGDRAASLDFQFQAAVVEFGLLLRRSPYRGAADFGRVVEVARASLGQDREGYRAEFVELVERARGIDLAQAPDRG
jgi:Ca-activated chloride channel family protein